MVNVICGSRGNKMHTVEQWVDKVVSSQEYKHHWLARQYIGEVSATNRMRWILSDFGQEMSALDKRCLLLIIDDEVNHAEWIKKLLTDRNLNIPVVDEEAEKRYWAAILPTITSFNEAAAAGHLAEQMRLERIRMLAADQRVDDDIRSVFQMILPDEMFHAKAFEKMTNQSEIDKMSKHHQRGLDLLGLVL